MKPIEAVGSEVRFVPDEPNGHIGLIDYTGVLLVDVTTHPGVSGYIEGDEVVLHDIPESVAMRLPHQPKGNTTLLDSTVPLDPDHQCARLTPGSFQLYKKGRQVATASRGTLMDLPPDPSLPSE